MLEVPFNISSQVSANNTKQLFQFSVPFKQSSIFSPKALSIIAKTSEQISISSNSTALEADFTVLSSWPDGSIKWLQCEFIGVQQTNEYGLIAIQEEIAPAKKETLHDDKINIIERNSVFDITCSKHTFSINKQALGFNCFPWTIELISQDNKVIAPKVTNFQYVEQSKALTSTFIISGSFNTDAEKDTLQFDAKITITHALNSASIHFTLRNNNAMVSESGKWDLGNENSILFKACNIIFDQSQKNTETKIQLATNQAWQVFNNQQTLFQASSGGENWRSDNHIDANKENKLAFKGYQLSNNSDILETGLRASPSLHIQTVQETAPLKSSQPLYIHIKNFWQNFPKSITRNDSQLSLGLFPSEHNELHELQPGEQKTHTFFLALDENTLQCASEPAHVIISPEYLSSTNTLPFFSVNADEKNTVDGIDNIIALGLSHQNNFFEKREQIDEFGWRNFGDIYADHETLEYKSDDDSSNGTLISHYNNQYDPLYGFLRQYLISKDKKWWQLADDLAAHVKDIDIYHTDKDKVEYNHGLFWHTDHYLPAETATHRTYSKHQAANAYQDHAGGGGPGGQHCYTTGLALHYLLTGDETSKSAVLNLAQWITYVYEGNGAFFDTLLKIKNRYYPGVKNVITGQYPLDRGTGNYIVALIDAYQVSNKQSYLDQASLIIRNTASPSEDLNERHLNNIEECWFYTVFLQAVGRYLQLKEQLNQYDESFSYAQSLLLHFANWMSKNEQPYLATPDALEYPNHTWAAQDIRKANVLYLSVYYAKKYTNTHQEVIHQYQQKADEIYRYVEQELGNEKTRYFARILSILMQNHGIKAYVENTNTGDKQNVLSALSVEKEQPEKHDHKAWKLLFSSLMNTSIKTELTWLRQRVKKVDNVLLKLGYKP